MQDAYQYAALKSLPLVDDANDSYGASASQGKAQGKALALDLLTQCDMLLQGAGSQGPHDQTLMIYISNSCIILNIQNNVGGAILYFRFQC